MILINILHANRNHLAIVRRKNIVNRSIWGLFFLFSAITIIFRVTALKVPSLHTLSNSFAYSWLAVLFFAIAWTYLSGRRIGRKRKGQENSTSVALSRRAEKASYYDEVRELCRFSESFESELALRVETALITSISKHTDLLEVLNDQSSE
jgi:hypothetical protein